MQLAEWLGDSTLSTSIPSMNDFERRCFSFFMSEKGKSLTAHVICIVVALTLVSVGRFFARVGWEGGVARKVRGGSKLIKLSFVITALDTDLRIRTMSL